MYKFYFILFVGLLKSHSNIAKHLVETNYEVASLLSTRKDKMSNGKMEGNAEQRRKLARMQRIRQLDSIENVPVLSVSVMILAYFFPIYVLNFLLLLYCISQYIGFFLVKLLVLS